MLVGAYWKKGDFKRQIEEDFKRIEARGLSVQVPAELKGMVDEILDAYDRKGTAAAHLITHKHAERAGELIFDGESRQRGNTVVHEPVGYAEVGNLDKAFELLQRAIDVRDPALVHLAVGPEWDSMGADPRFNQCLARMKLRPVL